MTEDTSSGSRTQREQILATATLLMGEDHIDPEVFSRQRGWLDERGAPTQEGLEMLRALGDQQGTRSVFRPF